MAERLLLRTVADPPGIESGSQGRPDIFPQESQVQTALIQSGIAAFFFRRNKAVDFCRHTPLTPFLFHHQVR